MLLITDSFFIKSNLQEPLKNVFSVRDLGLENTFSIIINRLLISTVFFFFQFWHLEVLFFCIYNGLFKFSFTNLDLPGNIYHVFQTLGDQSPVYPLKQKNVLSIEQPKIFSTFNQQSMHQEYITNVQQRRKRPIGAFLMLFFCRKKPLWG